MRHELHYYEPVFANGAHPHTIRYKMLRLIHDFQ